MDLTLPSDRGVADAVHLLENLLEDVIRYLDGENAAALVRRAREVARAGDEAALEALFDDLAAGRPRSPIWWAGCRCRRCSPPTPPRSAAAPWWSASSRSAG